MTLVEAMGTIADVQIALLEAGYPCGNWGYCGDGVDGRWGQDSQSAFEAFKLSKGLTPKQVQEALTALGVQFDAMTFQTAVGAWNVFRSKHIAGGKAYEEAANAAFTQATGITQDTCPPEMVISEKDVDEYNQGGDETGLAYAPPTTASTGWPWWLWVILGLMAAGAVGGGIWYWTQYKKRKRRKSSGHKGLNGYGQKGPEITDEEFGSEQIEYGKDDDQDDDDDEVS